ncbi:hypothetical protein IGS68_19165 [Skermanella sp. TT6]|uniref:Mandelate racemase/muconate lactonizing enzyme C-terminal domain-containing protein n=1 Tax=Skermanella cutis TaxID=2775420 RepID=A0ABX7B1H3_9PROT|nr:enolase C-terminal domain-like protein [Skermanella sp. TT6]QQP88165.1 hypothetical protein IGS68_19165 [Skermanella sp. TT6]
MPAYDSFGLVDPVADRAMLEAFVGAGFWAIKIKIGERSAAEDAAMVRAVRDIVGPDVQLMVDLNQSQSATEAIRRIERLAAYDLAWVEEPVAAEDLEGHARVRAASPVPVQTGENWWFPSDMARAVAARACDLAMPDLMKIGGITGWLRAMALAEGPACRFPATCSSRRARMRWPSARPATSWNTWTWPAPSWPSRCARSAAWSRRVDRAWAWHGTRMPSHALWWTKPSDGRITFVSGRTGRIFLAQRTALSSLIDGYLTENL